MWGDMLFDLGGGIRLRFGGIELRDRVVVVEGCDNITNKLLLLVLFIANSYFLKSSISNPICLDRRRS